MTQAAASIFKIPTESPQPARGAVGRARRTSVVQPRAARRVSGVETRAATRGGGEVIELDHGITVYPPRDGGVRWRAAWYEDGKRQQCESVSEEKLAGKLEKVRQRLAAGASNMTRPGPDLIAWYLNADRLPVAQRWSRKHADSQRRLCERFAAPVISKVTCQDITVSHMQQIVNAAPTASEGDRVHRMLSALVGAGIKGGYLVNPMLAQVHWQAGDRPLPVPKVTVAGESALLVDPCEIPSSGDVGSLGRALTARDQGERDELMANLAAYSGLRWGELASLTIVQVSKAGRVITVDRKVVEVRRAPARYGRRAVPLGGTRPGSGVGRWSGGTCGSSAPTAARCAVHVEAGRGRRVADGRARQLPDHARHVRRHHCRRLGPRPHRHRVTVPALTKGRDARAADCPALPEILEETACRTLNWVSRHLPQIDASIFVKAVFGRDFGGFDSCC